MTFERITRFAVVVMLAAILVGLLQLSRTDSAQRAGTIDASDTESALPAGLPSNHLWIDRKRLLQLPTSGPAWDALRAASRRPINLPDASDQDSPVNVTVLAKALVYARTGDENLREAVIRACMLVINTERGGRALALGKELIAYVLAADLVGLPPSQDERFKGWLRRLLDHEFDSGKTLRSTHRTRPNNWGTYAGASRLAVAGYLGDQSEFADAARVFKGWLGDREAYSGFTFKGGGWQADPDQPVGINPAGARRAGHSIDGVLPDDQRRGGGFRWPPPGENYVYSALQGALAQAVLLDRAGYPVWQWEDAALRRAFEWLHGPADYAARGDDTWQPHVINYYYDTDFPAPIPSNPGKNLGWTDWTHRNAMAEK